MELIPIRHHFTCWRRQPGWRPVPPLWTVCLLAAGLLWGCAAYQAPDGDDFRGVERLVLAPFTGTHGQHLQRALFDRLVLHSGLAAVCLETHHSVTAESLGGPEGGRAQRQTWRPAADAVVSARTTAALADSAGADRVEVREGTGQFREIRDVDGNWVAVEIMRTRRHEVPFIVRQATLSADFRLDHLKHAAMSFEKTATVSSTQKYGGDSRLPLEALPSAADTERELVERLAARMARELSGGFHPDLKSPLPRH